VALRPSDMVGSNLGDEDQSRSDEEAPNPIPNPIS
jgi:hypothetical protein